VLLFERQGISLVEMLLGTLRFIMDANAAPVTFLHLVVMGLLVWHSVEQARTPPIVKQVLVRFQIGLLWFLIYGMIFSYRYVTDSVIGFYLFLFTGLVALSMARIASLDEFWLDLRTRSIPQRASGWLLITMLAALVVTGLAILMGWVTTWRIVEIAVQLVMFLLVVVAGIVIILISPLIVLLLQALPSLSGVFNQLLNRILAIKLPPFLENFVHQLANLLTQLTLYLMEGRKLLLVGVLLGLGALILFSLKRRSFMLHSTDSDLAESEQVTSLETLLNRLLNPARWRNPRMRTPAQLLAAAHIRRVYRQLMRLCHKLGHERPPALTPLEFLPQLEHLFPGESSGLKTITDAYLRVRYGQYPETFQEVSEVQLAWERVRRASRRIKNTP
jgi:hypothetical protein